MGRPDFASRRSAAALLAAAVFGWVAAAPAQAMSLREAGERALQNDPRMLAADSAVQSSQAGVAEATAAYRPRVNLAASVAAQQFKLQGSLPAGIALPDLMNPAAISVHASQPLYSGGLNDARAESSRQYLEGARQSDALTRQGLLLETAAAYLQVVRDRAITQVQRSDVQTLEQAVSDTQKRFDAGEATRTDVAQATARLAEARAGLSGALAQQQSSEAAFQRVVGAAADQLDPNPPSPVVPNSEDAALEAVDSTPEVQAAQARFKALQSQIAVAQSARRPTLALEGSAGEQNDSQFGADSYNNWSVQLKAAMPIYAGGAIDAQVAKARADAAQAQAQVEDARRAATERITRAWNTLQAASAEVDAYKAAAEANALALDNTHKELEVGTRTTLDLLNAERDKISAEVNYAVSRGTRAVAAYQLLDACGQLRLEDLR
jgi:TolC family type I secretion outer membrane protein